jgi:hypothetical protein
MTAFTDTWAGGRERVLELFAAAPQEFSPDIHEHAHHDGGYYAHHHPGGQAPHSHTRRCEYPSCRHNYEMEDGDVRRGTARIARPHPA